MPIDYSVLMDKPYKPNNPPPSPRISEIAWVIILVRRSPNIGPGLICAMGGPLGWKGKGKGLVGVGVSVPSP